jgi:hypothetical protein
VLSALGVCVTIPAGTAAQQRPQPLISEPSSLALSLVVPGAGQVRQRRWAEGFAFAGLELLGWWFWAEQRATGGRFRDRYRSLADASARLAPSASSGDFEYFERMGQWLRSGAFDADQGQPGLQPETDLSTWNGAQWRLAANLHLQGNIGALPGSAGYEAALAVYRSRAYGEGLLWDWSADPDAQLEFRSLMKRSDEGFRRAGLAVGMIVANHLAAPIELMLRRHTPVDRVDLELLSSTTSPLGSPWLVLRVIP